MDRPSSQLAAEAEEFTSMKNSPTSKVQQGFKAKELSFSTSDPNNIAVVKVGKNV